LDFVFALVSPGSQQDVLCVALQTNPDVTPEVQACCSGISLLFYSGFNWYFYRAEL